MIESPENNSSINDQVTNNQSLEEQAASEEIVASTNQEASQEQQQEEVNRQETYQAKNFRALREKAERVERERNELAAQLREIEIVKQRSLSEKEDDVSVAPDDLVEGKHLNKYDKKIKEIESRLVENQLRSQYSDFDKVVSPENIKMLSETNPAIAQTLRANTDLYSQAVTAYTLIKNLGIYQEDTYGSDRDKVARNNAKPRPLASVSPQQGDSPLSKANAFADGLTDELKQSLYKEMLEARKKC